MSDARYAKWRLGAVCVLYLSCGTIVGAVGFNIVNIILIRSVQWTQRDEHRAKRPPLFTNAWDKNSVKDIAILETQSVDTLRGSALKKTHIGAQDMGMHDLCTELWALKDPEGLLAEWQSGSITLASEAVESLFASLADKDLERAKSVANSLASARDRSNAWTGVLAQVRKHKTPQEFFGHSAQCPDINLRQHAELSVLKEWGAAAPETACMFAVERGGHLSALALDAIGAQWGASAPHKATEWIAGAQLSQASRFIFVSALTQVIPPTDALKVVQDLPAGPLKTAQLHQALGRLTATDPEAALKYVSSLENPITRANAQLAMISSIAEKDTITALTMLEELPNGTIRASIKSHLLTPKN